MIILKEMFIINIVLDTIRSINITLCEIVYKLIAYCYDIFMLFTEMGDILSSDKISEFYSRIGLILGFFMIFRVMISFLGYIINPDDASDTKKGYSSIIKRILIVIILLGSVRAIFDLAFDVQYKIVKSNVIPNLIIGGELDSGDDTEGTVFADIIYNTMFYNYISNTDTQNMTPVEKHENDLTIGFIGFENMSEFKGIINRKIDGEENGNEEYVYNFEAHGLIPLAAGLIVLWLIITYTIQLGIRCFQLAYLELIAPIPIMFYLDPSKEDLLKKWTDQCVTTYIDVFIRIATLYFIVYLMTIITESNSLDSFIVGDTLTNAYISTILILALMSFAKKIPNLIQEVLPTSSNAASLSMGLSSPKELWGQMKGVPLLGAAVGGAAALAGKGLKSTGKFAWKNTGGRAWDATGGRAINKLKGKYNNWNEGIKGKQEYKDRVKEIDDVYAKYGDDFSAKNYDKVFDGNQNYINSYKNLAAAKDQAEKDYGKNTYEYEQAIKSAKEAHEVQQKANPKLASREAALKEYEKYHPTAQKSPTSPKVPSSIIIEDHVASKPRKQEKPQEDKNSQHANLVSQYEQEKDPIKKAQLKQKIDDFERKN